MFVVLGAVIVVVALVVVARRRSSAPDQRDGSIGAVPASFATGELDRWCEAGLIAPEQVDAIRRFVSEEAATPEGDRRGEVIDSSLPRSGRRSSRVPLIAEALGYLGGVLAGVGVVLVVAHYWGDLAVAAQVALTGGASLALFGVGAMVGRGGDPAFERMRAFLWAVSAAAAGACGVAVARGCFGIDDPASLVLAGSVAVAGHSGALWRLRNRPVQQGIALIAVVTAIGAAVALVAPDGWWGVAVWTAGAVLAAFGLRRWGSLPELTEAVGGLALVVGSVTVASTWESGGSLFFVATALALGAVAMVPGPVPTEDRWILGTIGAVAGLVSIPGTVAFYAQQAGATVGALVWLAGAGLLALGVTGHLHLPLLAQALGSVTMLAGSAVVAAQWPSVAPAVGVVTAIGLLVVGSRPGAVLESLAGALGLLVFVPWAVTRWFPGERRAPVLLVVSGLLIVAVAVLIGRMGGRMRQEFRTPVPASRAALSESDTLGYRRSRQKEVVP